MLYLGHPGGLHGIKVPLKTRRVPRELIAASNRDFVFIKHSLSPIIKHCGQTKKDFAHPTTCI
jgi:hypothetical protein